MNYPTKQLQQSVSLINKDLSLENPLPALCDEDDTTKAYQLLKSRLTGAINYLLDNNLSQLLNALYRMDANEVKVKHIIATCEPGKIAEALAELVIEREVQKVMIREKYKSI
jgi:arginine/lysine/ornithine decarboxylase